MRTLIFSMLRSIARLKRICQGQEPPRKGGETRKRKVDNYDNTSVSEVNSLILQPRWKRLRLYDQEDHSRLDSLGSSHNFKVILGWLISDEIATIGIYGMGGIGKTTLAMQVHKWVLHNSQLPSAVASVSVGMHLTVPTLQTKIAEELGFDLQDEQDIVRRAAILHSLLALRGNTVIILDDLWEDFRLEIVGIPRNCKLVITSRSLDVCRRMRCQKVLKIEQNVHSGPINRKHMLSTLKLSYANLNNVTLQCCFLFCAMYPKEYAIDREELVRVWIGEKLIDDVQQSLRPQYDKGHTIVNKLLNSCLLEACQDKSSVKMHDLVRDMALTITTSSSFMVKAGLQLTELPEWQEDLRVVSLMKNSISEISYYAAPKSPNLSTLLFQHNPIQAIPESFFLNMPSLRVLNLSHTHVKTLPTSMSDLKELLILDVSSCQYLKQVPSLEKLQKLRFFDLSNTAIEQFPHGLGILKMLRELNLSCIPSLKKFASGVLSSLVRLKSLTCDLVDNISELQSVKSLEILDARFLNPSVLSAYVKSRHWYGLECFHLQVGDNPRPKQPCSRRVSLHGCSLAGRDGNLIVLPDNIQELYVADCRDFSSLSDIVYQARAFSRLETCTIRRCNNIDKLFSPTGEQTLLRLEEIEIEDCRQLKEIIAENVGEESYSRGSLPVIKLPQLKRLELRSLPQLNSIYKGPVASALLQLLTVLDCPKLNRVPFIYLDEQKKSTLCTLERIEGQKEWWELLEWDEPESKALLKLLFRCISSMC